METSEPMARDSQQIATQPFKKGDILWVMYRKKEYIGKVTAYYPKDKKISYIWFPLKRASLKQSSVFKTDQSKARLFMADDDPLPENADEELAYSYDQAIRLMNGTSEEEVIEDFEQSMAEQAQKTPASGKKKSTADLLKKATGSTKASKTPKSAGGKAPPKQEDFVFQPGEQIIVDTQIGMWPGIFESYVEGEPEKIRYKLFPRKTSSEILIGPKSNIIPFPRDQIESSLQEGNGSVVLMEALQDAFAYVQEREAQQSQQKASVAKQTPVSSKQQHMPMPKAPAAHKLIKPETTTPKENIQKTPPNVTLNKSEASFAVSTPAPENPAKLSAQPRLSQKRKGGQEHLMSAAGLNQQSAESPVQPNLKRRKLNISTNDDYETEEERQLSLFPERRRASAASREKSTSSSPQKAANINGNTQEEQPQKLIEEQQTTTVGQQNAEQGAGPVIQEKRSIFELIMSEEGHQHMRKVWSRMEDDCLRDLIGKEYFHVDFRNGGLLTFNEIEKVFNEVKQWIKLSHIMPTLTNMREMCYIATHALPELCVFALSQVQGIPLSDAKRLFEERRLGNNNKSPEPSGGGSNASKSNSLDTLVMAANMMKGVEEQNGNGGTK